MCVCVCVYVCACQLVSIYNQQSYYFFVLENRTYFHIYNQVHQKCVSIIGKRLFVTRCDLNKCAQKWSLTPCKKIISAHSRGNPECISVRRLVRFNKIIMEPCQSTTSFKKWECKDGDLLSIQGEQLYFNYGNFGNNIALWPSNRGWSRWVKYSTERPICDEGWFKLHWYTYYRSRLGIQIHIGHGRRS